MHMNRSSQDSPTQMCLPSLTVYKCAWPPNRQSPFPSPSRASWIKMKDKHFLLPFSTSAGAHLINFFISLGTNDLRDSTNPKTVIIFSLFIYKNTPRLLRKRRRECMDDNSKRNKLISNAQRPCRKYPPTGTNIPHSFAIHLLHLPKKNHQIQKCSKVLACDKESLVSPWKI